MFELRKDDPDHLVIVSNSAHCTGCGDDIFSAHRHDMQWCKCGNIAVDGGQSYFRRAFADKATYIDTSISMKNGCIEECGEDVVTYLERGYSAETIAALIANVMDKWGYFIKSSTPTGDVVVDNIDALSGAVQWGIDTKRNEWGILFAFARAMRDTGILKTE